MQYWLMKSEPDVYSIEDLETDKTTIWDGVRNYQARNFLRQMQPGDLVFFYHSNTNLYGIVGLMKITKNNINDPTQFELNSEYYDPKSSQKQPRWQTVKVEFIEKFSKLISLKILKQEFANTEFLVIKKGNRLSVMPVSDEVAEKIFCLSK